MSREKKGIALIIILVMIISTLTVFANEAGDLNKKLDKVTSEQNKLNNQLKQKDRQQKSLTVQIQELEAQIDKAEKDILALQRDINSTQKKIVDASEELEIAEENIDNKQDMLGQRIRVMYKNGSVGYAEVLLNSKDFSEFLTNLDMVKRIVNHDVDLLKYLEEQKALIEDKKAQLENERNKLVNLRKNVEDKKNQLSVSRGQQERLRKDLERDKVQLAQMLDQLEKEARALEGELRKLQSGGQYVGGQLRWPVPGYSRISSPFGNRIHPILKTKRFHSGIDIPAPTGTPIVAAGQGKVITAGTLGSYGRTVIIDHGGGIVTLYAHNSKLLVSVGDHVSGGQRVSLAGSTGMSTGPHLHFEVRKDAKYVDPIPYVRGR